MFASLRHNALISSNNKQSIAISKRTIFRLCMPLLSKSAFISCYLHFAESRIASHTFRLSL